MDIRIASVFSLSFQDPTNDEFNKKRKRCVAKQPKVHEMLTDKYCSVSLLRIDLGNRKHVSYRKWMKSHNIHCTKHCAKKSNKYTTESSQEANEHADQSLQRKTRNSKQIENDNDSFREPQSKRLKRQNTSTHEESHLIVEENQRPTELKNKYNRHSEGVKSHAHKQAMTDTMLETIRDKLKKEQIDAMPKELFIERVRDQIKKEPTDTATEESIPTVAVEMAKERSEKESISPKRSFDEMCKLIAEAPKEERATYIEKLKTILHLEEQTYRDQIKVNDSPGKQSCQSKVDTSPAVLRPNKETKTLATLQLVHIGGTSYVVPTSTPATDTQTKGTNNKRKIDNSESSNHCVNVQNSPNMIRNSQMLAVKDNKAPVELPAIISNSFSGNDVSTTSLSQVSNVGQASSTNISTSSNNRSSLQKSPLSTASSPKEPVSGTSTNVKEMQGYLISHPDGKKYFVPLMPGETFQNKPSIKGGLAGSNNAVDVNHKSMTSSAMKDQNIQNIAQIAAQTQNCNNQTSKSLTQQSPLPQMVIQMNQLHPTSSVSQHIGQTAATNSVISKLNTVPVMPSHPTLHGPRFRFHSNSCSGNSSNAATTTIQNNISSVNSLPRIALPVLINGTTQNILFNVLPDGKLTLVNQNECATIGGKNNFTQSQQEINVISGTSGTVPCFNTSIQPVQLQHNTGLLNNQVPQTICIVNNADSANICNVKNQAPLNISVASSHSTHSTTQPNSIGLGNVHILNIGGINYPIMQNGNQLISAGNIQNLNTLAAYIPNNNFILGQVGNALIQPINVVTPALQSSFNTLDLARQMLSSSLDAVQCKTNSTGSVQVQENKTIQQLNTSLPCSQTLSLMMQNVLSDLGKEIQSKPKENVHDQSGPPLLPRQSTTQQYSAKSKLIRTAGITNIPQSDSRATLIEPLGSQVIITNDKVASVGPKRTNGNSSVTVGIPITTIDSSSLAKLSNDLRVYSPTDLMKNVIVSKDYCTTISENVSGTKISPIPMHLKTSSGNVVPCSAVKPSYDKNHVDDGKPKTSLLNNKVVCSGIQKPLQVSSIYKLHSDSQIGTTLIPAQGYSKTTVTTLASQNIPDSHPLLKMSLQNKGTIDGSSGNPISDIGNEQSKRNKRKPQVVLHIDKDNNDKTSDTSASPDNSMIIAPSVSTSKNCNQRSSIIEIGLRIPDSMLAELEKKQLSVETTIQKLKQSKLRTTIGTSDITVFPKTPDITAFQKTP